MRHISTVMLALTTICIPLLAACSDDTPASDMTTDTELGNVDIQEGTISDDMIEPDTILTQTPDIEETPTPLNDTGTASADTDAPKTKAAEQEDATEDAGEAE